MPWGSCVSMCVLSTWSTERARISAVSQHSIRCRLVSFECERVVTNTSLWLSRPLRVSVQGDVLHRLWLFWMLWWQPARWGLASPSFPASSHSTGITRLTKMSYPLVQTNPSRSCLFFLLMLIALLIPVTMSKLSLCRNGHLQWTFWKFAEFTAPNEFSVTLIVVRVVSTVLRVIGVYRGPVVQAAEWTPVLTGNWRGASPCGRGCPLISGSRGTSSNSIYSVKRSWFSLNRYFRYLNQLE